MAATERNPFRLLPSVEEVLSGASAGLLAENGGALTRGRLAELVGEVLEGWRREIKASSLDADGVRARLAQGALASEIEARLAQEQKRGLVRVVNATGVVLHTGLGRAPVHPEAAAAMERAARTYGTLEVDRFSGERNQRDAYLSELLVRLTGAEAAIAVNNCAGAVLLLLNTFAAGKQTIVSRGELVEIGGSFRMPDVMVRAGTELVEVGTTNRTRAGDVRAAVGDRTGLLLKVHTSNFRVVGFTEELDVEGLAELGRGLGVTTAYDLGSGRLEDEGSPLEALGSEPSVRAAVASGVDVVAFSGDKLLGAPQAGVLAGTGEAIAALRANPLYRALRLDKVTLAGLETTLALYLQGRAAEIPTRAMLDRPGQSLRPAAERIAATLARIDELETEVVEDASRPGSGSAPEVLLPSPVVRVASNRRSAATLARDLRHGEPSLFARIHEDRLLLDPRTLLEGDEERLLEAFTNLGAPSNEERAG